MVEQKSFENYRQLVQRVDQMFDRAHEKHPTQFNCQSGCYSCCHAGLSITNVEASHIESTIKNNPETYSPAFDMPRMNNPDLCEFLDHRGGCSIYPVRPLICRSHGMPVSWREDVLKTDEAESEEKRDVCPLNFTYEDLNKLEDQDVLSLDKLNRLLSLIDRQFQDEGSDERVSLKNLYYELFGRF